MARSDLEALVLSMQERLDELGISRSCPVCSDGAMEVQSRTLHYDTESLSLSRVMSTGKEVRSRSSSDRRAVVVRCNRCGFFRLHDKEMYPGTLG